MEALVPADVIYDCQAHSLLEKTDTRLASASARTTRLGALAQALGHEGGVRAVLTVICVDLLLFFLLAHRLLYDVESAGLPGLRPPAFLC